MTTLNRPATSGTDPKLRRKDPLGCMPLYGEFYKAGVNIEWHQFEPTAGLDWSHSFHPESVEICLNLAGNGCIRHGGRQMHFGSLTSGFYLPGRSALIASRQKGQEHRFVTIRVTASFLREHLAACDGALNPLVEGFLRNGSRKAGLGEVCRLTTEQQQLALQLRRPPVYQGARRLWYQSKILQLMADFFFIREADEELFCDRQKRVARERVDRVIALLRSSIADPPNLEEIGRRARCSPFYLSRTFSAQMGVTIPQFLRKLRMERAAELLKSGRYNVTEAAMEVGYSSLSHFSQAFCQTIGCCPALYPHAELRQAESVVEASDV